MFITDVKGELVRVTPQVLADSVADDAVVFLIAKELVRQRAELAVPLPPTTMTMFPRVPRERNISQKSLRWTL